MKTLIALILFCCSITLGFSKNPEDKTFLVIFDKSELAKNKTSVAYLELSLKNIFETKSFSGNSDSAIIVKIPHSSMDICQLSDYMIRVNQSRISTLGEIAFKIYDLNESKEIYEIMLTSFEESSAKIKKLDKNIKVIPAS